MSSSSSNIHQRYTDRSSFDIREENLIAIGAGVRRETGKDVFETDPQLNEWMQRVKKLGGGQVETEDDERSKRLEEEIIAQRKARKERREERKRSLSPLKDSPRSIASGPRSPAHSILSRETRDSDETSPIGSTPRWFEREQSPTRGKDESRIDRDKVGEMLLGKNPEFFRQKEKPVGFIKPTDGGDGGLRERNGATSAAMPLPGMRPTKDKTFLTMISQGDMPSEPEVEVKEKSPYNTVSRFAASKSSPSLASHLEHNDLHRTDSLPTPQRESMSTKPSMPWIMPSSTRGAGGFVASAALKRSSTVIKPAPSFESTDLRTRPATMYGRPAGHQRDLAGSITSTGSLSPRKLDFSETRLEKEDEKPTERQAPKATEMPSKLSLFSQEEKFEEPIPKPPPHKTPPLLQNTFATSPTEKPPPRALTEEVAPQPSPIGRPSSPPPRLPASASTDSLARKRWSPTKSSWLDSALQKANDPPSSPPKRMSSIRPIAPAVPTNKWSTENKPTLTKSTSFTSALGGMGGRRDVTGITPPTTTTTAKVDSSIEARLAALEKRVVTPPSNKELPRSQSLRDTLKPVSPTPSPPTTKPKWSPAGSSTAKASDPVKERLLAARSGLSKTPVKPPTFSDPLKEGIIAAREKLKVQNKEREKKEDELKASILNARKGLRRPGSKEETERSVSTTKVESTPPPRERQKTPVIEKDVVVKQEEITPEKPKIEKVEPRPEVQKPVQSKVTRLQSATKPATVATQQKQPELAATKSATQQPVHRSVSDTKTASISMQPNPAAAATSKPSPAKITTSPVVQKKVASTGPVPKPVIQQSEPLKKENDSPTPQKKFEKSVPAQQTKKEDVAEVQPKPSETVKPVKQTSLPTAAKAAPAKASIVNRFNPALATMLSKGPHMMAPEAAARPVPVKSLSAPEPLQTKDIDDAKQLTHLTKGRARGPKKRNSVKKTIIKEEPEPPPQPIMSSVWNKPAKSTAPPLTRSPEAIAEPVFPSTPDVLPRLTTTITPAREREKSVSSPSSMKQRLAELSPLRRRTSSRGLFGNLLRSPSQPAKTKYPSIEIIPSSISNKIIDKERLFVQAWSIVSRVKHVSLPNTEEHILYTNDMHAFLYMFNDEPGAPEPSAIKFLWVGKDCKTGEKEGMEFVRLMGDQNADTQVIQQGHESPLFMRALGGVIVTRSGTRRPLNSTEDALFCVRECMGGISIDQVEMRKGEFCSGFSYVVKKDGDVFVWHGNGSLSEEIAAARRFAGEISSQVREMMEGDPVGCAELWKCFEDQEYASGDFWRKKYDLNGFTPSLYVMKTQKARQLISFSLEDISLSEASVLDGGFVIYLLIPPAFPQTKMDVGMVLQFAKDLADRADSAPATFVVHGTSSPPLDLKAVFRQPHDKAWPFKRSKSSDSSAVDFDTAFDMLDRERYSIKELQGDTLPLGVDIERIEYFLSDEEFELIMGMNKTKYDALPPKDKYDVRESGLGLMKELRV